MMKKNIDTDDYVFKRDSIPLNFAKITELIVKDLNKNTSLRTRQYTRDNIATFLQNPKRFAKDLQGMSEYLYNFSHIYRRLVNYYARMATLDYFIEPYGIDFSKQINEKALRNNYYKALDLIDLMNIKHEYGKALVSAWKLGTFYGYELYTKDTYFIMELPYEYCQISGIMDGVFTFSFDMSYFERNPQQVELYPKEIVNMFNSYKNGSKPRWQEIDPSRSVCIKIDENNYYDIPPFVGIFADIFDLEDYKSIRKTNTALDAYKFIVEKIPIRKDSEKNNDFSIDLDTVAMFHNKTANLLPDEIGIFSTPFEVDTIEFSKDKTDKDVVEDALNSLYDSAGTSRMLFNGSDATSATLSKSINVDESEVFSVLRQLERIITGKIKNNIKGSYKFRLKFLDKTIFNKKEFNEELIKSCQYGFPLKTALGVSLGISQSSVESMSYLENNILKINESFIPLSSSHTQSNSVNEEKGGRPQKDEDELTEKGLETRNNDGNNRE